MREYRASACGDLAVRVRAVARDAAGVLGEIVGLRVFDTLGALAAGARVPTAPDLPGERGLIADVRTLCAAARCSETDDFDRWSCTTPGSTAVPVALAVGAEAAVPAERVRAGVIAGYEAMVAVGDMIGGPDRLMQGVWPSYLAAPLSAAAATSAVLDLDEVRTTHALAIAAVRAVGTSAEETLEPSARWLGYGCAATDGVLAGLAAEAGMTGDPDILTSALAAATGAAPQVCGYQSSVPGITRVDVKPFCTARQVLAAVEAAQRAHRVLGDEQIAWVEVAVPKMHREMVDQPEPLTRLDSITSAQRQVALALDNDAALYDVARQDLSLAASTADLMELIHVVDDHRLTDRYPDVWGGRVRIRGTAGHEVEMVVDEPLGARERPLRWTGLRRKHERIGALGGHLGQVLELSRELGDGGRAVAQELLYLTTTDATRRRSHGLGR